MALLRKFRLDDDRTSAAIELSRAEPKGTTILLADLGRQESRAVAEEQLARGQRILADDLFDVGELKVVEENSPPRPAGRPRSQVISDNELRQSSSSLKGSIESAIPFDKPPDRSCFNLHDEFDFPPTHRPAAPRRAVIITPKAGILSELTPLKSWYAIFGVDLDPTR